MPIGTGVAPSSTRSRLHDAVYHHRDGVSDVFCHCREGGHICMHTRIFARAFALGMAALAFVSACGASVCTSTVGHPIDASLPMLATIDATVASVARGG